MIGGVKKALKNIVNSLPGQREITEAIAGIDQISNRLLEQKVIVGRRNSGFLFVLKKILSLRRIWLNIGFIEIYFF